MNQAELDRLDEKVLTFIQAFQLREGIAPSREEIARALRLANLHTAQRAVERLADKGLLRFQKNSKRGIEVPGQTPDLRAAFVELPLLGDVAAGRPIEAVERDERIQVPSYLVRGAAPHFVLRVRGNSMVEDHIQDGDWVIVRKQAAANNGEKVVALIDNEATLKRFYSKQGRVELHPANETMSPIIVEAHQHLRIEGVYVGHIHREQ